MVRMWFTVPWASGVNRLDVKLTAGKIRLPWVGEMPEVGIINAACRLACCLLEKAKEQKRVSLQNKPVENEKYAFRCSMLRLDFIGDGYRMRKKRF